jgi:putative hemolysin
VTTEDLLEELVGDILAEHEKPDDGIHREEDGAAIVRGSMPIREVNRALDVDLPESTTSSTVAGLCIHLAGWIPQAGARLTAGDGTIIDVLDATPRTVEKVRIRPRPTRDSG